MKCQLYVNTVVTIVYKRSQLKQINLKQCQGSDVFPYSHDSELQILASILNINLNLLH